MKKHILLAAALFLGLTLASVTLTSCEKDEDEIETPKQDTIPASVQMTFTFNATQEMLDYCDIVVKYNDGTGEKTETVTAVEWTKTVKVALPATLNFSREATLKASQDAAAAEKVSYTRGYGYSYVALNAQGERLSKSGSYSSGSSSAVSGEQFVSLVNEGRLNSSHTYAFDKNGDMVD